MLCPPQTTLDHQGGLARVMQWWYDSTGSLHQSIDHTKEATVHEKHLAISCSQCIRSTAGLGIPTPQTTPAQQGGLQGYTLLIMTVLDHRTKSTDHTKRTTVHKKHLAKSRSHYEGHALPLPNHPRLARWVGRDMQC